MLTPSVAGWQPIVDALLAQLPHALRSISKGVIELRDVVFAL